MDWKSWHTFLERVEHEKATLGLQHGEDCLYRGHTSALHHLVPSLYRVCGLSEAQLWQLESDLFFEFQSRSRDVREYTNDWDVLFFMRHHGVPTRLLDWTEVLGVALFFAVLGHDEGSGSPPRLWLLNPWGLNSDSWGARDVVAPQYLGWDESHWEYDEFGEMLANYDEMPWDGPVAIYPRQSNPRMAAQRGLFTIHGNDIRSIEEQYPQWVRPVDLDPHVVKLVAELLEIFGFDQYLLFPDSVNLAHALGQKYGLAGRPEDRITGRRDAPDGAAAGSDLERQPTQRAKKGRKRRSHSSS